MPIYCNAACLRGIISNLILLHFQTNPKACHVVHKLLSMISLHTGHTFPLKKLSEIAANFLSPSIISVFAVYKIIQPRPQNSSCNNNNQIPLIPPFHPL